MVLLLWPGLVRPQKGFQFESSKSRVSVNFKLVNNLIFVPVTVNGVALTFLLDTGVEESILLSLEDKESVPIQNVRKISLKGLGSQEAIEGLKSSGNAVSVGTFTDKDHDLYIVLDQSFNFSAQVGIPVNGILGYHFFKNHLIEIDYDKKKLIIHRESARIREKLSKRYTAFDISLERAKPYIMGQVDLDGKSQARKLLLDLGNSDAVWLFGKSGLVAPQPNLEDYLGRGFSGDIHGKRARIGNFALGDFAFERPIIAFPDSASVRSVNMVKDRAGSVGGEVFRRFDVVLDYAGGKIYLKKGRQFDEPFHYNMSGLEIQNSGMQWVQETVRLQTVSNQMTYDQDGRKADFKYRFTLKPVYTVAEVRPGSPAALSGMAQGDVVVRINGTSAHKLSLQQINELLKSEPGRWITIEAEREGQPLKFAIQLQDPL